MTGQDNSGREPVNAQIFPVPPVVAEAGLFIAAGLALNYFVPLLHPAPAPLESRIAGGVVAACAFAVVILAWREMRRLRTTFHPGGEATALVRSGIYTRTRNPMYLGLTLFTLRLGIGTANPWLVLLAPLLLLYLQERVVKREEAYLTARFGAEYEAYRRRVRRWF